MTQMISNVPKLANISSFNTETLLAGGCHMYREFVPAWMSQEVGKWLVSGL